MNTPFLPGDMLPPISLPQGDGSMFDVMAQTIAMRPRLLLLGLPEAAGRAAEAEAARRGALALQVFPAAPDGVRRAAHMIRLFDPDRRLNAGFGLPEGGVVAISPRGRLVFAGAGDGAVQAALDSMPPAEAPAAPRRGGAPVLLVPDILEAGLIANLLAHWEAGEKLHDRVASRGGGAGEGMIPSIKRRSDVILDDRALYDALLQRIERRAVPEMWRAFRFRAARFEPPRIGCYDAASAGAFGAHRDNRTPYTAHRRFAMSLNLNSGAYEGGTIVFPEFGPEEHEPPAGAAAIFCCDLLHEAKPVTKGRRFAVFTFFTDAEGARDEDRVRAAAAASGQSAVTMR
jgi:predicted 2-oxoglutarate/Fe(II)-dependent dioxygenase YbiX